MAANIEQLYQQYAGRASDPEGFQYWTQQFGDAIDPDEINIFQSAVAAARAQNTEPAAQTLLDPLNNAATGAAPVAQTPDYAQMVRDAYGSIGRTGFGDATSNIDQAGFDYWLNTLQSGASTPEAFNRNFQTAVFDYMGKNPQDQYSTYVADYLQKNNNQDIAGVQQLYKDVLGRDADASGLSNWYQQFGSEISPEERAAFETSAKTELDSRVQGLYRDFLGRDADAEGLDYWKNKFGSSIDDAEREQFRQSAASEINKAFGATDNTAAPTTEGILSGFKYANDLGLSEEGLKKTLGEDVFNTYKTGFADYAKTGIADILADNKLSFDEAREAVKFGREYGYDSQELADLTGQRKELFDAINTGYETGTKSIVDTVLGAEDVTTDADRVIRSLALQQKYGFTDEDLAKASNYDAAKLKADLDPVRNFEDNLRKAVGNTDSTAAEIKKFTEDARSNGAISQLYGSNLNSIDTKIAELEERWKDYKDVEPVHAQRVFDQLSSQREAVKDNKYYQGTYADPMRMSAALASKGIDTLADIVQKEKYEATPADQRHFAPDGTQLIYDGSQGVYGVPDSEGGYSRTVPKDQVKTEYGYTEYTPSPDGESQIAKFVPLSDKDVDKDGNYQKLVGKVAVDKDTGEEIAGLDGTIASEKSGGKLNRKRNELNVHFTDQGVPVLYSTREKTGFGALVQDLMPMISMALPFVLPGIGSALSGMLPGAGVAASGASAAVAPTLMNQALTQGIISGGLNTLGGGNFGKGFLSGAVNPYINAGIGAMLPTEMDPRIARAVTNAGSGVIKGALQGGNFEDLLGQGILSDLTNYGLGEATRGLNLTPQQLNFATGIALPLLQGEKLNPAKVLTTLASADQQRQRTGR